MSRQYDICDTNSLKLAELIFSLKQNSGCNYPPFLTNFISKMEKFHKEKWGKNSQSKNEKVSWKPLEGVISAKGAFTKY